MRETPAPTADLLDGRYRLLGVLARGGMATVHRAHDAMLDREVAIKILHPHLTDDPAFLDRFRREAQAAAALSHPNVVQVYDRGETSDTAYLVMELVDGPSLRDVLRTRGRLTPGEILSLLAATAEGLGAAHAAGLVHRDVKPENILIDARTGTVKLTDFGLARAAATATHTFGPDALAGSPHYLPPEAVNSQPLDARSDVYSLGIVLYECLVGQPPLQGDTPMATALSHTTERVPRPSVTIPGVPAALDDVVVHATMLEPSERYADAAAFADALAAAVPSGPETVDLRDGRHHTIVMPSATTETVVSRVHQRGEPGGRRERRRGRRVVVLVLLFLLAAVAGAWAFVIAPVTPIPDVAGEDGAVAEAVLREAGFDVVVAPEARNSLSVPADHVFAYTPTASARRGATVTLTLSAGPRQIGIPDVDGLAEEDAIRAVVDASLVATVEREHDEEVAEGLVIRAEPASGSVVDESSTVVLVVSDGPAPIELPSLVMQTVEDALGALDDLGLTGVVASEEYDDEVPVGFVISQRPAAGTTLFRGDRVEVVVSLGPQKFPMPDVRELQESVARARLEGLGLVVRVEKVDSFFKPKGEVAEQDPKPGKDVRRGDEVTIFVWD